MLNLVQLSTSSGIFPENALRAFFAPAFARTLFCCFYGYARVRGRTHRQTDRHTIMHRVCVYAPSLSPLSLLAPWALPSAP